MSAEHEYAPTGEFPRVEMDAFELKIYGQEYGPTCTVSLRCRCVGVSLTESVCKG